MNKLNLLLAFSLAAAAAGSAHAETLHVPPGGAILTLADGSTANLPHCTDSLGLEVRYAFEDTIVGEQYFAASAGSIQNPGEAMPTPLIYLKPGDVARRPARFAEFVAEHECAHHRLGHQWLAQVAAMGGVNLPQWVSHAQENMADCEAAKSLAGRPEWREQDLHDVYAEFPRPNLGAHPPVAERLDNALQCFRAARAP